MGRDSTPAGRPPEHAARLEAEVERDILESGDWSWVTDEVEPLIDRR
jgi:hypothetical protein